MTERGLAVADLGAALRWDAWTERWVAEARGGALRAICTDYADAVKFFVRWAAPDADGADTGSPQQGETP